MPRILYSVFKMNVSFKGYREFRSKLLKRSFIMTQNNPTNRFYNEDFPKQYQPYPGIQNQMTPVPDCGEETYEGSNKLVGKKH